MSVVHDEDTPLPVGNPMGYNGEDAYQLGMVDGTGTDDYWDDPWHYVVFASPEAAKAWLKAVHEVLDPYIATGDDAQRVPYPEGWRDPDEVEP